MVSWILGVSMLLFGAFVIWIIIRAAQQFGKEQEKNNVGKKDKYKGGIR